MTSRAASLLPATLARLLPPPFATVLPSALAALALVALAPRAPGQCTAPSCEELSGDISDATTGPLLSGNVYLLASGTTVPAGETLTVQPGAIIKQAGYFWVAGTLLVQGTAAQPVVFTSRLDDTAGGDTNGDGAATTPGPGDWLYIGFASSSAASVLENMTIRYGGMNGNASVQLFASGVTLDGVTISDASGDGIDTNGIGTSITNCHFENVAVPITDVHPNVIDNLVANTGSGNSGGNTIETTAGSLPVSVTAPATWSAANTINGTGTIVLRQSLMVDAGQTLTWGPGLVLKMNSSGRDIEVRGTLVANGSAALPIVITSIYDDAYGGVTEPGVPAPGDWRNVHVSFFASGCEFRYVVMRYGGEQGNGTLRLGSDALIENCLFEQSASSGVAAQATEPPVVTDSVFLDNAAEPITAVPLSALSGFSGNQAMGNGAGDVIVLGGGTLGEPATLSPAAAFNGTGTFVLEGTTTVGAGGVLTVDPGVIFKGEPASQLRAESGGQLLVGGPGDPVVFTSLKDDTWGGDINGDGAATSPAPGDWTGLRLVFASDASVIDNAIVRYASGNAIWLVATDATILDTTVEQTSGSGLFGNDDSLPTVSGCDFVQCGGEAPVLGFELKALPGFTGNTASGNAGGDSLRFSASFVDTDLTIAAENTLNSDGVLVLAGSVTMGNADTLTLEPGVVMKFDGPYGLRVGQALMAPGTAADPIVFTSFDDDWGGDTDGSGGAPSEGTPGSWDGLEFFVFGSTSQLTNVFVRNAGANGSPSIEHGNGDTVLDQVTVERGLDAGLLLSGGSPTVTGCAFDDNDRPVEGITLTQLPGFSGNTASGNAQHDSLVVNGQGTYPAGGWQMQRSMTLNDSGVVRMGTSINLGNGSTLTIGAGMVLKWTAPSRELKVSGTLLVEGTAAEPVVFTSHHDDDFGGPDDDATEPAPGDWTGLRFFATADASVVNNAIVRYAGNGGEASVVLDEADVTFCDVRIERGAGAGLDTGGNSAPSLKNVAIDDNLGDPIEGITWNVLGNMKGVTAQGNGSAFDTVVIDSPVVSGAVTIEQENVFGPCIVVNVTPDTSGTDTLSFGRGIVVKAGGPDVGLRVFEVEGTGLEKTVFTSIHDDEWAGDTNGNGSATVPVPGDWIGVSCTATGGGVLSGASVEHALIRWAGADGGEYEPTGLYGGEATGVRVEYSAGDGVSAGPCENVVAFANAGTGIDTSVALNCTAAQNATLGIRATRSVYCVSWNNGPTFSENYYEVDGPIVGCPPCLAEIVYCIGTDLGTSPPVQGAPGFFGCPNTGWGNTIVDPLFVDEANGDLRLLPGSPAADYELVPCPQSILLDPLTCTPWGPEGQGYPEPLPGSRDHRENSRFIDATLTPGAQKRADLGAHERVNWTLEVDGDVIMGQSITLRVEGPPGSALLILGLPSEPEDDLFLPVYGFLMVAPELLTFLPPIPAATDLPVLLPVDPALEGVEGAVQAMVTPTAQPTERQLTNVFRPRFRL